MINENTCSDEKLAELHISRDFIDMALESIDYEGEHDPQQAANPTSPRSCAVGALFMSVLSLIMVGLGIGHGCWSRFKPTSKSAR
jgi:hypothetical protein